MCSDCPDLATTSKITQVAHADATVRTKGHLLVPYLGDPTYAMRVPFVPRCAQLRHGPDAVAYFVKPATCRTDELTDRTASAGAAADPATGPSYGIVPRRGLHGRR